VHFVASIAARANENRSVNTFHSGGPKRFRLEWLGLGVVLALFGAVIAAAVYREFGRTEAEETGRLQAQARVIEDNLVRQLEGANHALVGIRDRLVASPSAPVPAEVSRELELLTGAMPGVRTMTLLDAGGTIVASSRDELVGRDASERDFFVTPRERRDTGTLYVSTPFRSPLGPFVIVISRVVMAANGRFAGVVAATLDPAYFDVVLRSVLYAPDMRTSLVHGSGQAFLTVPVDDGAPGTPATSEQRMTALQTVDRLTLRLDKPLVTVVSRQRSAVFESWRAKAWRHAAFFAVVSLAMGSGLLFSQRRRRTLARLAAQAAMKRQEATERLELALRGADLGLWDIHLDSSKTIANARECAMLGFAAHDELPHWRSLIHPDDWPTVKAALERHLQGRSDAYECEHRVRHTKGHWVWVFARGMVAERNADGVPMRMVGTHLDITAVKRANAELARAAELRARSEERLSLALEGSGLALFDWDIAANRIYQSAQAAAMCGEPPVETTVAPRELRSFVHRDDLRPMLDRLKEALTGASPLYYAEFRIARRSGAWLWIRARGRVVERDAEGRALRLAGTYADIHERKVSEARLRHLAEFDQLTGLPNRAQFMERLRSSMGTAKPGSTIAVLFLDIDHFKTINDTLGHEAGDQLLKVFAQRMRASVRQTDLVARLAGDEFTVILEALHDERDASVIARKLVEALREPIALAGKLFEITASVGVALCSPSETDEAALLRRADVALYEAKRRGRNGYFCDEEAARDVAPATLPAQPSVTLH
jgi:diguanylate cyclase (GGDEF)-like protein/PAS domain S-box-containing protein